MDGRTRGERPVKENTTGAKASGERAGGENPAGRNSAHRSRHRPGRSGRPGGHVPAGNGNERNASPHLKWREYVIQLSVVIIGIMVTFIGSDLISRWSRQRQVKTIMQLVVEELKENRKSLDYVCEKLEEDQRGMLLIREYDFNLDTIPVDSLDAYRYLLGGMRSLKVQSDALEVLKTAGVIPSLGDKTLLMEILKCYSEQNEFRAQVESYNKMKMNGVNHMQANPQQLRIAEDDPRGMWKEIMADPVCASFISSAVYYFGMGGDYFARMRRMADDVITAIVGKYGFEGDVIPTVDEKYGFE